jgi:hypothetical protein
MFLAQDKIPGCGLFSFQNEKAAERLPQVTAHKTS